MVDRGAGETRPTLPPKPGKSTDKEGMIMEKMPIALIFRKDTGCKQYPFFSVQEVREWANRRPYRDEVVRVMPVIDRQAGESVWMPAMAAAEYLWKVLP